MKNLLIGSALYGLLVSAIPAAPTSDIPGAKDHPNIPRLEGSVIIAHEFDEYGDLQINLGSSVGGRDQMQCRSHYCNSEKASQPKQETVEGRLTRNLYLLPPERGTLEVIRQYQAHFSTLGEVETLFQCSEAKCGCCLAPMFATRGLPKSPVLTHIWGARRGHKADNFGETRYYAGKIKHAGGTSYITILTALNRPATAGGAKSEGIYERTLAYVQILDVKELEEAMVMVKAEEMQSSLDSKGHIALYGIYFDFNSDQLKAESDETLVEIAKLLKSNPGLDIHVVGHTDGVGSEQYNLDLSNRRARSVVNALTTKHGIEARRLTPFGAGLYAPVASNKSEEGRAKNRRVELVERYKEK
jgi:outer membrane protein OmpA-like peptidoglycan-associated protein